MPLEKSYSDASAQPPKRGEWQRTRSNPAANNTTTKKGPLQSLAPVSESTKNKLQAFRSDDTSSKPSKPAKAAKAATDERQKENVNITKSIPRKRPSPDSNEEESSHAKTPADRHSWKDLFDVPEATTEEEDGQKTPGEKVDWRSGMPLQLPASPMIPKNGTRRAKSSSPASSPAAKLTTPHVNLRRIVGASKTPHADPASDLWTRFSSNGTDTSPSSHKNPLFAQLMASCSPRPQSTDRSLRKSVSCGSAWPKRRRTDGLVEEDRAVPQDTPRKKKSSLLSELLQSVDGEIESSKKPANAPAQQKKSPSPKKKSPSKRKAAPQTIPDQNSSPSRKKAERQTTETAASNLPEKASSDYGDDDFDFDEDTLLELDASFLGRGEGSTLIASDAVSSAPRESSGTAADNDEFGDLDDDIFDGVEDLVAQAESATQQPTVRLSPRKRLSPKKTLSPRKRQSPKKLPQQVVGDEDDEFGDDFGNDFDFDAVEMAATQHVGGHPQDASSHPSQKPRAIQRYLVTKVLESSYTDDRGREFPEKILIVQADRTNSVRTIYLRGDWLDTPASVSAYVHIIGQFEDQGRCVVDNNQNMLILHPDQLISSTVVADSFSCMRRAVLQDRVKATSDLSPALVYGTILHEIFQEALVANKWDPAFLAKVINKTLEKHLEDLYILKVSMDDAKSHVQSKMPELRSWAQLFVTSQPKPDAIVQGRNGDKATMCVSKLLDVEEHVWSPMYGLKGNIDATVQVTMRDPPARGSGSKAPTTKTLTVPFEVKTGKNVNSNHQAQTALYNLLLSDRYDIEIVYGILYYMETSQTLRIPAIRHEIRHMIMQRNQLACYIRERSVTLPPMKRNKNACGRCYAQTTCFIYHKLADDGDGETSAMNEKFDEVVQHLNPLHKEFFLKWEELLTKEEKESQKLRRELWTMVSTEREKVGRCFANVIIEEGSAYENHQQMGKTNRFAYTFIKEKPPPGFSFLDSQLTVGEPIVISDEQGHFALALGYVTSVRKTRIAVAVDRRLHNARVRQPGFNEADNQVFASIMQVPGSGDNTPEDVEARPVRYRLDKDEFSNGMATVRNNLVQVMADGVFGSRQIRRLVVDLDAPRFKDVPTQYMLPSTASGQGLNVDQKAAVQKVMSAQDYALVLGMPGTGKTTTIVHIIRALVAQKKTVLLTSYTHTAVDNILLKLKDDGIPILRLGPPVKVHPEVPSFATLAGVPKTSFSEIHEAWNDTPVVATTCLGINHPVFAERIFDYCIVDEASQITLPICLGPIRMARKFVLVGDHNQLPPLVQNEEARLGGLDVSLFKLLSEKHPQSVVNLEHQYRMCEDIMTLSNMLIYNGRLKCGTEALRTTSLEIPDMDALAIKHFDADFFLAHSQQTTHKEGDKLSFCPSPSPTTCWLRDLLDPSARVRFINTDSLLPHSREEKSTRGQRIINPLESRIVCQLVDSLLTVGVPASEIGVMTHYRSQLALLKHNLKNTLGGSAGAMRAGVKVAAEEIEMHTADRFQGRDKSVVVLSLVRSNEGCSIGELLKDWRRINVAFTRAKTKLLVVGSRETLRGASSSVAGSPSVIASPGLGETTTTTGGYHGDHGDEKSDEGEEQKEPEGGEMLARFVRMMEDRNWVYELGPGALEGHKFADANPAASTAADPLSPRKPNPVFKLASPRKGSALSPSKRANAKVGKLGYKVQSKLQFGTGTQQSQGKENVGSQQGLSQKGSIGGKHNPKRIGISERAIMKGRPIMRDIMNEITNGRF
ncbi:DNA replication factor Dna2-domain-containing protein [Pseudoneurospora amorphoporcata]|uniref:DNA replication ATP-dependent helicase/nuclease n=1 Tax=Pseudoneurospora amorphoporcata TaxID=241081 RepID=A0AAN6NYX1_9PEZI|nr:DNA replication factor Dna2-domain-containing protein [Pseudoneurospora amorphoporcata]